MARPPMPVGTWGNIKSRELDTGQCVAQCRFRDFDGAVRQVKAHGRSKAAAERRLKSKLATRAIPTAVSAGVTEHTTVSALCTMWLDGRDGLRPQTVAKYRRLIQNLIGPAVGELRVRELTAGRVDRFLTALTPGNEHQVRPVLKQAMGLAVKHDVIAANPLVHLDAKPKARAAVQVLEPADLMVIRRRVALYQQGWLDKDGVVREQPGPPRSRRLVWFFDIALGTGLRAGEILALRWGDIDLDVVPPTAEISGTVVVLPGSVVRQEEPKTESGYRMVLLPPFVVQVLAEMADFRDGDGAEDPLFPAEFGGYQAPGVVQSMWARARRAAGGPEDPDRWTWVQFRTMRRTVATAIDRASGLEDAAAQLGHADTAVTARHYVAAKARRAPDLTAILEALAVD